MGTESTVPLHVDLPTTTHQFAQEQAAACGFANVSDYVASLVQGEQRRKAQAELEALLLEGLDTDEWIDATPEYWAALHQEIHDRFATKKP